MCTRNVSASTICKHKFQGNGLRHNAADDTFDVFDVQTVEAAADNVHAQGECVHYMHTYVYWKVQENSASTTSQIKPDQPDHMDQSSSKSLSKKGGRFSSNALVVYPESENTQQTYNVPKDIQI